MARTIIISVPDTPSASTTWNNAKEALRKQLLVRCETCVNWTKVSNGQSFCAIQQVWMSRTQWCDQWHERS